jgi:succinylarginine dihydrolase
MTVYELNMDGLVGPTHHYAGLAFGNIASTTHAAQISHPKAAAKQGIAKMRLLHSLGLKQGLLPPHMRPNLPLLHELGFGGEPTTQISKAAKEAPALLRACYSSAGMWTANSATVTPSCDAQDGKVHITAANLVTNLHRQQEGAFTSKLLATIFSDPGYFTHHPPLPYSMTTNDEGAANHSRLCASHDKSGLHLFVYGKEALNKASIGPVKYPARQSKEACEALARRHGLAADNVFFAQQNPKAIDQGVFHNDVIATANEHVLLIHEEALLDQENILQALQTTANFPLHIVRFTNQELTLQEAVETYLFNSQLLTLPDNQGMMLIAPEECNQNTRAKACIEALIADKANPIAKVHYLNLRESMQNGGGPACLRLRLPLQSQELSAMHQGVLVTTKLLNQLEAWVDRYYPDSIQEKELADPQLMYVSFEALDKLTQILGLGSIYPFQVGSGV